MKIAAWIGLVAVACKAPVPPAPEGPPPVLELEAPWTSERSGDAPVLVAGRARLFVGGTRRGEGQAIPGLALGDTSGPRLGLLGGSYAPILAPIDTDRAYRVEAKGLPLRLSWIDAEGHAGLDVRVLDVEAPIGKIVINQGAVIWLAANRTDLMASYQGKPSFSTPLSAGDPPEVRAFRADQIDVDTKAYGRVTIETSCTRPRLVRPVPRGSTSVFGILIGAPHSPDPFYDPSAKAIELSDVDCRTTTSTLSFRWP